MQFELEKLPYEVDALAPHIRARTVDLHYNKHHAGYMSKLKDAITGKPLADLTLAEIVIGSDGDIFRNAAQVWNHTFYWNGMQPHGSQQPSDAVIQLLRREVGGVEEFKRQFAEIASGEFGSGWAWLVASETGRLEIMSTTDADNPLQSGFHPILTLDVWEHAYYLDYQNDRERYIKAFLDHLIDWRFFENNLGSLLDRAQGVGERRSA